MVNTCASICSGWLGNRLEDVVCSGRNAVASRKKVRPMPKNLLVVGGGIEAVPGLERGRQMGLHLVVSDKNPDAPGFAFADNNNEDKLLASTYDIEATVAAARRYHREVRPIHGVMCIASDIPRTVAAVAADLGLPGISQESARLSSDKLDMKLKFRQDGVPVPWFSLVESAKKLHEIVLSRGFPLVIKPVDSRGARGVLRLTETVDLEWAYQFSARQSPSGRVIVEEFLEGPQISTESIVLDGIAHTPGLADRNYEFLDRFAPHIIENGGDLPTQASAEEQQAVRNLIQQAATSMGVCNGVVKGDVVFHDGKPFIIELATRLSGGYFCTHEIPLSTGVDFVGCAIRLALGEQVNADELVPRWQHCISQRYLFPSPGRVVGIAGAKQVLEQPGIVFCQVRLKVGDLVRPVDSHPARAGLVMAIGESRREAMERAEAAIASIEIETAAIEATDPVGANR
jgi:biotin carboxylase